MLIEDRRRHRAIRIRRRHRVIRNRRRHRVIRNRRRHRVIRNRRRHVVSSIVMLQKRKLDEHYICEAEIHARLRLSRQLLKHSVHQIKSCASISPDNDTDIQDGSDSRYVYSDRAKTVIGARTASAAYITVCSKHLTSYLLLLRQVCAYPVLHCLNAGNLLIVRHRHIPRMMDDEHCCSFLLY